EAAEHATHNTLEMVQAAGLRPAPYVLIASSATTAIWCRHGTYARAAPAPPRRIPRRPFAPWPCRRRQRPELAGPADQAPGSLRRRRQHRRHRPPDGGAAV